MKKGFTLIEVTIAVAVGALLIVGVSAATQSTVKTAERQKFEARAEEKRARAVELLGQDWRGRLKIVKPATLIPAGVRMVTLSTTADSLSHHRATRLVTWTASEKGLSRGEGGIETRLLPGPVGMDFWDGVSWRPEPAGSLEAIRLQLSKPEETVVLR